MKRAAVLLPPGEGFSPDSAGAIGLLAHRLSRYSSWGVRVLGEPCEAPFPGFVAVPPLLWPAGRSVRYARSAGRVLAGLRPSVIEVHNRPLLAGWLARRFPSTPVSLFLHNDPRTMDGARRSSQRESLGSRLARVVAVSPWVAERWGLGATVLPNAIDLDEVPAESVRENLVLFAGRLVPEKGPQDFLTAWAASDPPPGWRAEMFGARRLRPGSASGFEARIRAEAERMGVLVHGYRPHREVLGAMARAAIVVVPSRWPEPFGLAALDAMACGAALICTPAGNLPALTQCAAVLATCDQLAGALAALMRDDVRRNALGLSGRARAAAFATRESTRALDALRNQLVL